MRQTNKAKIIYLYQSYSGRIPNNQMRPTAWYTVKINHNDRYHMMVIVSSMRCCVVICVACFIRFHPQKFIIIPNLGVDYHSLENERMESKGSHKLFLKYHISIFHVCPGKKWYTSGLILHKIMKYIVLSSPRITLKCYISAALSAREMLWYGETRAIHCYWHISKPYLSIYIRKNMPTKVSTRGHKMC